MAIIYKNITSATTTTLIAKDSKKGLAINKILLTNSDNTTSNNVALQLNDGAGSPTTYQIFRTEMPAQSSVLLEDNLKFDNKNYRLEIITDSSAKITIIIT
jgi:hypothetical protein